MPEEIIRVVTDHISTILFPPTVNSEKELNNEGILENIFTVGDVMYDAVLYYKKIAQPTAAIKNIPDIFYLTTCHRQENTGDQIKLNEIFTALRELSRK